MATPDGDADHKGKGVLTPMMAWLAHRVADERTGTIISRDVDYVRRLIPSMERYVRYFSPEVRGIENLPSTGPVLVVGNHSGLFYMPDALVTALAIMDRRGTDASAYVLAYDLFFSLPIVGPAMRRLGAVPAGRAEAERVLAQGALLLTYPGGDAEACRSWSERNRIVFSDRTGFVRLALRTGVPIVPAVGYGGHHAFVVLSSGERLARVLGLERLRIKVFPILLGPFGVTSILTPPLPMPSAVTVEFMPPFDWSTLGPDAADDDEVVRACYEEIVDGMQATHDRLQAELPFPVLRGISRLLRGRAVPDST